MPFRTRAPRRVRLLPLAVALALAATGAVTAAVPAVAATPAAAVRAAHLTYVGTSTASTQHAAHGSARHRDVLPAYGRHGAHPVAAVRTPASAPRVASSPRTHASLVRAFDGVNAIQNKAAAGFDLEPPDEGLAAGNGYVVNFVNVTGWIQNTSGKPLVKPFYLNPFFHETAAAFTSDPRVFYDASTRRWFATIVEIVFSSTGLITESHVDVATSRTSDPRKSWTVYKFGTTNLDHAGCPCLADFPILGIDASNVYVSTNEYTTDGNGFNGAQLYAIAKSQLVAGSTSPRMAVYENLSSDGTPGFHVQPANTYGKPGVEYLMSSLDPNNTFDNRLAVWALTHPSAVAHGGIPALSVRVISSEAYALPPNAQTPAGLCDGDLCSPGGDPTSGVVATDFDAMQEVQYINGVLVGALNTSVTIAGDSGARAGVAWFVVKPSIRGGVVSAATHVRRQGYLAERGEYLMYPHINMTQNGAMALVFGLGGPSTFLSAGYSTAPAGGRFRTVRLAGAGVAPVSGFAGTPAYGGIGRWGDYSNGEIIPGTNRVWLATQYIPNTGDGNENWGDRIFELNLG